MKARVILLGLTAGVIAVVVYSVMDNPHRFDESGCMKCHLEDPVGKKPPLPLVASVKRICMDCHRKFDPSLSHPVEVSPVTAKVPADMPLSAEGQITCSTCHDIHSSHVTEFGTPSLFLRRRARGRLFCIICHSRESASGGPEGHSDIMQQAHFKYRFFVTDGSRPIDPVSSECLTCHDGSVAKLSVIGVGIWTHSGDFIGYDSGLHPIGVDYEEARRRSGGLRPSSTLDSRIRLVQGKVSCVSCHNPYSEKEQLLVMENRGSRLCLECHIK